MYIFLLNKNAVGIQIAITYNTANKNDKRLRGIPTREKTSINI